MDVPKYNYVGRLNEKCQVARISPPDYDDLSEGASFRYKCKLKEWVCHGTGATKKFAKQNAAKQMLETIENEVLTENMEENSKDSQASSVSKLTVYCSREKIENPLFSELPKENEQFFCKCSLQDYSAVGKGSSKKEAKENAASEVAKKFGVHKYWDDYMKTKEQRASSISPVGELIQFCQKKYKAVPTFKEEESKENNVLKYKAICIVGDLKEESSWTHSKKAAKCEVALLLLQSLKRETPQSSPAGDTSLKRSSSSNEPVVCSEELILEPLQKQSKTC